MWKKHPNNAFNLGLFLHMQFMKAAESFDSVKIQKSAVHVHKRDGGFNSYYTINSGG